MSPKEFEQKLLKLKSEITKELSSGETMQAIGEEAVELIKKRTRIGYGVDKQGGEKYKLAPLDAKYIKYVRAKKATGPTTKNKSNLTLSGQMLDNLESEVKANGKIEIGFKDAEASDKARWNTDKGRPFNHLSKAETNQLKNKLQKFLKNKLDLLLK